MLRMFTACTARSKRHRQARACFTLGALPALRYRARMDGSSGGRRNDQVNVFGEPLATCSINPVTGWLRSGCCETDERDLGSHTVCVVMTAEFLEFSRARGNDLSTPQPGFPGLQPGDRWCLCAARWQEAFVAGCPPRAYLRATHRRALEIVKLADLKANAIDLS